MAVRVETLARELGKLQTNTRIRPTNDGRRPRPPLVPPPALGEPGL